MITDFERGLWIAIEYLILVRDQPTFAKELIQGSGILLEDAVKIVKETNYQPHKIIDVLIQNKTWKIIPTLATRCDS